VIEPRETRSEIGSTTDIRGPQPRDEVSPLEMINVVLRNRRLVFIATIITVILIVGYTFIKSRTYSSSSSFILQSSAGQQSLTSNLAAQFGISIPTGEAGQSPEFYADLITTRMILKDLTDNAYEYHDGGETVRTSLPSLLRIKADSEDEAREKTIIVLQKLLTVGSNRETGLVSLTVQTKWAEISHGIARDILDLINQFNLTTRQTQASAEREFIEGRLEEVESELRSSEDALQEFLQKNQQWQESAELEFIHDRLYREVTMRQQVFTTLNQAYEQARIDEVRDTPIITLVEHPEIAILPDRRGLVLKGILSLIVGAVIGFIGAFGREFLVRGRQREADEYEEFKRLKKDTLKDIRNPLRFIKG
jgi:uncharacterized protein involved in exopolysaccharide biosynthesis